MDKNLLKKELLSRLPDGCALDDDLLDNIAGGLAVAVNDLAFVQGRDNATDSDLAVKSDRDFFGGPVLLDEMPATFASLEDMKRWYAERAKKASANKAVSI